MDNNLNNNNNNLNNEIYKKAIDKIHAPEDLKRKTLENIEKKHNRNFGFTFMKYAAACAVFVMAITFGTSYVSENDLLSQDKGNLNSADALFEKQETNVSNLELADLNTFKDIEELRKVLEENLAKQSNIVEETVSISKADTASNGARESADHSNTNTQVEGVDEADIIKTDGKYIYFVDSKTLYVIKASSLEKVAVIDYKNISFIPQEIFLAEDKLVVVGNTRASVLKENSRSVSSDTYLGSYNSFTQAIIYDISKPEELIKEIRRIDLDGYYRDSRMIGNSLYLISTKTPTFYENIPDEDILPCYGDSLDEVKRYVPANKIIYFPGTNNYTYVNVAGVDISKDEDINVVSLFGACPDNIYASENSLYIPVRKYDYYNYSESKEENEIYKFNLKDSKIKFVAQGIVEGDINSQFSIDEYNGYLRIATTIGYKKLATNSLYILDSNLEKVSEITDIAKGERIYSVRFMGKVGYIVTFEQVDPLFVVDLSDPYNPEIKGKLEIPGYSSYLHPYDENHIIGIGYNVKDNGYGGVKNTNMKMAMFDVSDLSNPKEMFSIDIGDEHVYSELNYNHKALFYSKEKNLIGFPIQTSDGNYRNYHNEFNVYNIDLKNGFTLRGTAIDESISYASIRRAIYVKDELFTLANKKIVKYNLNSFEKLSELYF